MCFKIFSIYIYGININMVSGLIYNKDITMILKRIEIYFYFFLKYYIYSENINMFLNHIYNIKIGIALGYIYNININMVLCHISNINIYFQKQ